MSAESEKVIELLQARIERLRLLGRDLVECRPSFVQLDLAGMQDHTRRQDRLCSEIQALDVRLSCTVAVLSAEAKMLAKVDPYTALHDLVRGGAGEGFRPLLSALSVAQDEVRSLSRIQTEMLSRSRRSLNALANIMPSATGTYGAPKRYSPLQPLWSGT